MAHIYIGFVDTPGILASFIRRVIKQRYAHVIISLDENLDEAYSIGRRHPAIMYFSGFEREESRRYCASFQRHTTLSTALSVRVHKKKPLQQSSTMILRNAGAITMPC